jgi:ribosomal protein S18 acetylase RimI-like enzyme
MDGVRFRVSRAADAQASAPLVHASGPESFDYVFASAAGTAIPFLAYALSRPGGEFGYATHVVGELDGRIVACGAGWAHGGARFALATAWPAIRFVSVRAAPATYRRGMQAETIMPPPAPGEYYVGHLGVDASLRGRGIGQALTAFLLAPARVAGCRVAVLDVSAENPRAQALYTRLGFVVTRTRASAFANAFGRVPSHHRMERELPA